MNDQETTKSELPPLDTSESKKYDSFEEKKEVKFESNDFTKAVIKGNEIVLPSGAAYSGPRLHELYEAMQKFGMKAKRVV